MSDDISWDRAAIARLEKIGGRKLVREMLGIVLDYVPKKLEAAREGERAGDPDAIQRAVHPIRSSAANVGARAVQGLADRIERLAMDKQMEPIPPLLRELEAAFDRVLPELERERDAP
ncbi:MAG: Hpt domain-containing protein [Verrucomicrobia bacterium]|nr:Hpt domain-containing protein [Verrucomicrobiota bacterium]